MRSLLIAGAGGHGVVVADAARESQAWSQIEFIDDIFPLHSDVAGWRVVGKIADLHNVAGNYDAAIVAIGDNSLRLELLAVIKELNISLATVVHPSACISKLAMLGAGTVVLANGIVNARAVIGEGCILNTAATVDHDCRLSDGVHIAPGANLAAAVSIGEKSWIGIGASVRQQVTIGDNVIVGAGAAVVRDIVDDEVVVGIPAKPITNRS